MKWVGWHHQLNGHGFEWTLGVGNGQGGLVCCGSWDLKESDTTEWLNWTELIILKLYDFYSFMKVKVLKGEMHKTSIWTEEPGGLQSMGSQRVRHDWATSLSLFTFMHWKRKWQPTPVFLPGESQGRGSLVGCRLWGRTESDTTEAT